HRFARLPWVVLPHGRQRYRPLRMFPDRAVHYWNGHGDRCAGSAGSPSRCASTGEGRMSVVISTVLTFTLGLPFGMSTVGLGGAALRSFTWVRRPSWGLAGVAATALAAFAVTLVAFTLNAGRPLVEIGATAEPPAVSLVV